VTFDFPERKLSKVILLDKQNSKPTPGIQYVVLTSIIIDKHALIEYGLNNGNSCLFKKAQILK